MKKETTIQVNESKKFLLAILVAAIAVTALLICASCSDAVGNEDAEYSAPTTLQADSEDDVTEPSKGDLQGTAAESIEEFASEKARESEVNNVPQSFAYDESSAQSAESSQPAHSASNSNAAAKAPEPQKRWVEDTERVWVVDSAAWTEQKPIYETRELSVCNVCGADITANPSPHTKAHMLAGEGGGYHSEVKQIQIGSETINHPETGHWETKVVGGHWE